MKFLHYMVTAGPLELVDVRLSGPANVFLLDPLNYQNYRRRNKFIYHGGHYSGPDVTIKPPFRTTWHIVVDQGGAPGDVDASVRVIPDPNTRGNYAYASQ
jgi:hypothetical protein